VAGGHHAVGLSRIPDALAIRNFLQNFLETRPRGTCTPCPGNDGGGSDSVSHRAEKEAPLRPGRDFDFQSAAAAGAGLTVSAPW
jgi:hypothetical protein